MTDLQTVLPLLALIPEPLKIGHFTFHARGPLQKALANGKLDKADLPFAPELLPDEPIPVAGKLLPVKAMLMAVLADGKFGPDDLLRVLAAWSGAPDVPKPAVTPDPIVTAPIPAPAPPPPPLPTVASVALKIHAILGPMRTGAQPVPYVLDENGTIRLTGDTTSLDDKSTIWLDGGASGPAGGLRIDLDPAATPAGEVNHPELLGKMVYIAEDAETGEELGRIGGKGLGGDLGHVENGVSFVPNRYTESGGMAVNARIKRKGGPILIYAEMLAVESNSFVTPEIR